MRSRPIDADEYEFQEFSEERLWSKIGRVFLRAGREVIEKALLLFFVYKDPRTPLWAKSAIFAALGYFIWPVDAVPDVIPVVGYSDDLGVLAAAIAAVGHFITPQVKEKAAAKLAQWFG